MSRGNYFAALAEEEVEPAFQLAPSRLAAPVNDGGIGSASLSPPTGGTTAAAEGAGAAGRAASSLGVSLASIADELLATTRSLPAHSSAVAAWDFSGLAASTADTSDRIAQEVREVEDKQRVHEARLVAMETDKLLLQEKIDRSGLSHNQRQRKQAQASRGEDANERLGNKVLKRTQAQRRRNQAKSGDY